MTRKELDELLGKRHNKGLHISLAYLKRELSEMKAEDKQKLEAEIAELRKFVSELNANGGVTLQSTPTLCYFHDMTRFVVLPEHPVGSKIFPLEQKE